MTVLTVDNSKMWILLFSCLMLSNVRGDFESSVGAFGQQLAYLKRNLMKTDDFQVFVQFLIVV